MCNESLKLFLDRCINRKKKSEIFMHMCLCKKFPKESRTSYNLNTRITMLNYNRQTVPCLTASSAF